MYDPSGLTNTTGNAGRGFQGQSTPLNFSSLGNLFQGSAGGGGAQSAPMNMMPQNAAQQPGNNFPGFMSMLGGAFGPNSPFNWQGNFGDSWRKSPLGQMFGGGSQGYTPEFGADIPRYLANQAVDRNRGGGPR
jgi:hypothetical protein